MGRHHVRVGVLAMLVLCAGVLGGGAGQDDAEAEAVRLATRTLSEHLGVDEQSVRLDEVVAVDWRDSSLSCPEPGRTYAPVVMSGYRVTLAVDAGNDDERTRRVHVAGTRAVVCEQPSVNADPSRTPAQKIGTRARSTRLNRSTRRRITS